MTTASQAQAQHQSAIAAPAVVSGWQGSGRRRRRRQRRLAAVDVHSPGPLHAPGISATARPMPVGIQGARRVGGCVFKGPEARSSKRGGLHHGLQGP